MDSRRRSESSPDVFHIHLNHQYLAQLSMPSLECPCNVISSAFGFIISNEVGRLQNRNEAERGEENGPCQAHEEEHQNPSCQSNAGPMVGSEAKEQAMEVDMLWEFDRRVPDDHRAGPRCYSYPQPPDELNNEEYEELLLTMERALYEDLRQEAEREEARTIREFEISHAMEDAVFLDAVDRFEEDKESGVVICPLCKEKYVRQCGPVLFCECRQFRLDTQDRKPYRRPVVTALPHVSFMADVFRRLPLLFLVLVTLVLVVVFHVCILGRLPGCTSKRRSSTKGVIMEGRQAKNTTPVDRVASHGARNVPTCSAVPRYDASAYAHLPPHEQPLPDTSDEEEEPRSRTVALGSTSTQEWVGSQLYGNRETTCQQSFSELLEDNIRESDDAAGVNLSFGLCSGSSSAMICTLLVNPHPEDDAGQVTAVGRSAKATSGEWVASQKTRERSIVQSQPSSAPHGAASRPKWMQPPSPLSGGGSKGGRTAGHVSTNEDFASAPGERFGRQVWVEHRQQVRREREECIMWGVQRLHVREGMAEKEPAVVDCDDYDDATSDDERRDDETTDVQQIRQKTMGGRSRMPKASSSTVRRGKKGAAAGSEGEGDVEGEAG
ncbi:hypothetical protein CBR_g39524 [Chara braunii]|uniref:RPA-interacting protein central domain-containing protein n=1 Tax=Chara braunii TaxID=69332 RepID=A0A388LS26_CHABU|nr:hypothetical protein CBR_g39524 [Chara braunii]|eukprot:GBG85061.1 hypothetical protein CBR_g39524 [Chara braunii]